MTALKAESPDLSDVVDLIRENPEIDSTVIGKLLAAKEKLRNEKAKRDFEAAMVKFHGMAETIKKDQSGPSLDKNNPNGPSSYNYVSYGNLDQTIRPWLLECGLTYRHRIMPKEQGQVHVTCIVAHEGGWDADDSSMQHGADSSGGKSDIQGKGSSLKYMKKMTLEAAFGLSTEEQDDDGVEDLPKASATKVKNLQKFIKDNDLTDRTEKYLSQQGINSLADLDEAKFDTFAKTVKDAAKASK